MTTHRDTLREDSAHGYLLLVSRPGVPVWSAGAPSPGRTGCPWWPCRGSGRAPLWAAPGTPETSSWWSCIGSPSSSPAQGGEGRSQDDSDIGPLMKLNEWMNSRGNPSLSPGSEASPCRTCRKQAVRSHDALRYDASACAMHPGPCRQVGEQESSASSGYHSPIDRMHRGNRHGKRGRGFHNLPRMQNAENLLVSRCKARGRRPLGFI